MPSTPQNNFFSATRSIESLNNELFGAAEIGLTDVIEELVVQGANVNILNDDYNTPLCLAAKNGHIVTVDKLMDLRAVIHSPSCQSAINLAVANNHINTVLKFIERGAALDYAPGGVILEESEYNHHFKPDDYYFMSPLMVAAKYGNLTMINLLLTYRADINFHCGGKTALMIAVENDQITTVKELISLGANNDENDFGGSDTALVYAVRNLELLKYLISVFPDNSEKRNRELRHALIAATRNGNLSVVEYLVLEHHVNVDYEDDYFWTPLIAASNNGFLGVVEFLIRHGADANFKKYIRPELLPELHYYPVTALMAASHYGHLNIIKKLLEHGADPKETDEFGNTALIFAEKYQKTQCVEFLATLT